MHDFSSNKLYHNNSSTNSLPLRSEIEEKYKWNLQDIYTSDEKWEEDFKWIEEKLPDYKMFEGKLHENPDTLLNCLKFDDSIGMKLERLHLYSMLARDADLRDNKYQAMDDRIKTLYSNVTAASSFIRPELLQIPDKKLLEMINSNNELRVYEHSIKNLLRTKSHTLSHSEEKILALASEITLVPYNTYSMFTNADLKLPQIKDEKGKNIQLSHARFYAAMYSKDRAYRKRAFMGYLNSYKEYVNTLTSLFNGNLKTNIFNARTRNYSSALEAALDKNNIPADVYFKLVETANNNLSPMHRWAGLKKELLHIDELHPYDVYVTLFNNVNEKKYEYDDAVKIVINSLKPMGEEYIGILQKAFNNRWIDVYETQAKKSGAYSSGTTYGVHPYVLLNWTNLLNDVFTLAHEMGHNMHSYFTGVTQPYPYANYSIFLAEVASTFNESLLLDYLIEHSESKEEKLFLLEKYLNNITSTFYRQVMFAEFEMLVYERTEKGEALTPEILSEMYSGIYQKYWGPEMVVSEEEKYTWARIPHFYYNFYVFQYATGFAASEVLSQEVMRNGSDSVTKYLNFLKAGSSDYPINILKSAGVDMSTPEPVTAVAKKMDSILDEMESLL